MVYLIDIILRHSENTALKKLRRCDDSMQKLDNRPKYVIQSLSEYCND